MKLCIPAALRGSALPLTAACHSATPALTTVHVQTARTGTAAAEPVLARLRKKVSPRRIELPVELVIRRSSAPPAPAEREV